MIYLGYIAAAWLQLYTRVLVTRFQDHEATPFQLSCVRGRNDNI